MKRLLKAMCVVAVVVAMSAAATKAQNGGKFVAPKLVSAGEIAYPANANSPGFVTLQLNLDGNANIQNVQVVRDVPPLTSAAQTAVQGWSFTAGTVNGSGAASSIHVTVVFNPFNPAGVGLPSAGLGATADLGSAPYIPARVASATYATYPSNTTAFGTVVLDVRIGSGGDVKRVNVVHGVAALTGSAITAVKTWGFIPAKRNGKAVDSRTVVAFVFPSPALGTQ
jgi:TonB family protein